MDVFSAPIRVPRHFSRLRRNYPELWEELRLLSDTPNMSSDRFKYDKTFIEVDAEVDRYENEYGDYLLL